ncbi:MAG: AbrB/MazE/SpoVT family DNA-binding domain-containing protein [Actinomycetota bacterium]
MFASEVVMAQKVGPKGQVVVPKEIRDQVGLDPGTEVLVSYEHGAAVIRAIGMVPPLQGSMEGKGLLEELRRMRWGSAR